jgi:pyruvate kinase
MATLRRLTLVWGVYGLLALRGRDTDELVVNAIDRAREAGYVRDGDRVVVTAGVPLSAGNTNLVKVEVVGRHERM